jgi:formylglycine-generating enzyme required for sulfatase activity
LSLDIAVRDAAGDRTFSPEDLPLGVGPGEAHGVRLPGSDGPAVGFLGYSAGRFFIQPGSGSQAATLDGSPLGESRWISGGEVLLAGGCAIAFDLEPGMLRVSVDPDPAERTTVPPVVEAATAGGAAERVTDDEETIAPMPYEAVATTGVKKQKRRFPVVGAVLTVALTILGVAAWFMFTARSVEVIVSPMPEDVSLHGTLVIKFGPRYLVRPGEYEVRATLAEYEPLRQTVEVTDQRAQTLQLTMTRLPDRLFVSATDPADAQVALDGEALGEAPIEDHPVRPGRYRLEVSADRYVTHEEDLDVEGGGNAVRREVTLVPDWAEVTIASTPEGATVLANGEEKGVTPLTFELRSGLHDLQLRKSGFKTWQEPVTVEPDKALALGEIRLKPSDGKLVARSEPDGATVLVDGQFRGQTPVRIDLDPGRNYRVEVSRAGYETQSRTVRLSSGQTRTETFRLKAVTGVLELIVAPEGVEFVVDGRSRGAAPARVELIAVPHRLEFRKPGYVSRKMTVKPTPGIPQRLEVKLLTEEEAALAAIPKTITTAQGSELTLVPGGRFKMGATRGEPGRRANEGLREVRISKPFYIGVKEVTNREFREYRRGHSSGVAIGYGLDGDDFPVVRVTWQDAAAFCNWLSQQDALPPAYQTEAGRLVPIHPPTTGYRLPTEAEWTWAARYAGRAQKPPRYPWGDSMPPTPGSGNYADVSARAGLRQVLTSYNDDYPASAHVGRFRPNALGLFDVGGNVSEWTNDLYRAYTGTQQSMEVDPVGAEEGRYYVLRGSSWRHGSISELRFTWRDSGDEARPDLGFRLARSIN